MELCLPLYALRLRPRIVAAFSTLIPEAESNNPSKIGRLRLIERLTLKDYHLLR